MISLRLQPVQLGAGLVVGLCCLALGGLSLSSSLVDYRRVKDGTEAFRRFEIVSDAVNAVVAERAPANALIAIGSTHTGSARTLGRARAETDRLLRRVQTLIAEDTDGSGALYAFNEMQAHLAIGRQLVDTFILADPATRQSRNFKTAFEKLFAAAEAGDSLRERLGQVVVAIAPEVSTEVFLSLGVSDLRDFAGRFGTYVVLAQREGHREAATAGKLKEMSGRIAGSNRILSTLAHPLSPRNGVAARLKEVEQGYFDLAFQLGLDVAAGTGETNETGEVDFVLSYGRGLSVIDGLREAVSASSQERLRAVGEAAFHRAAVASSLMLLVCLVILAQIVVFRRALFAPLGWAYKQAIAIASGDLSEPARDPHVAEEIREVLVGLDAIRGEQRWRRELEEQQAEMSRQLRRLSETDMLTGLLNRRAMEELAARTIAAADEADQRLGVLLFDLDHFKFINDTFGHAAGDEVLRVTAREVPSLLRPQDYLARFGGEEFLVLLPDVDAAEARAIAATLHKRLPELVRVPGTDHRVTASFGLAFREAKSAKTWDALVAAADRRLYTAKRGGRDRICDSEVLALPSIRA